MRYAEGKKKQSQPTCVFRGVSWITNNLGDPKNINDVSLSQELIDNQQKCKNNENHTFLIMFLCELCKFAYSPSECLAQLLKQSLGGSIGAL